MALDWADKFGVSLSYGEFLERHGQAVHRQRWQSAYERVLLSDQQRQILNGFVRTMNVLCLAGAWCGDCVDQCPIFQKFATETTTIRLKFLDRDAHADVQQELSINGGRRVPVVVFLSEDLSEVARYGERTISRYRQLARDQFGPACPTGITVPNQELLTAVTQDWLTEFERVQLLLRLSPRLRQKHED